MNIETAKQDIAQMKRMFYQLALDTERMRAKLERLQSFEHELLRGKANS